MKGIFIILTSTIFSTFALAQNCDYKSFSQNGVTVKQFNPMPIGGDNNKQVALSISNFNGNDNLMITIRFKGNATEINKKVKITLANKNSINLIADRIGSDYIGGSPIKQMIFSLNSEVINQLMENQISSLTLNTTDIISAKMFKDYIGNNLKCLN